MIIMSVDYGDVRTGVAVSDKTGFLASPVSVITQRDPEKLAECITECAKAAGAQRLVVGLPRNMDGSEGFRAEAARAFAALLSERSLIEVVLWDERLSTVSAHAVLSENDVRGKKRKQSVDAVAAVIILQDYLDSVK